MILPSRGLLLVTGFAIVPLCAAFTLAPQFGAVWLGAALAVVSILVVDAALGGTVVRHVSLSIPAMLQLTRNSPAAIDLSVVNGSNRPLSGSFAVAFPSDISGASDVCSTSIPARGSSIHRLDITANRRGRFSVESCSFQVLSPLRLWLVRRTCPLNCEIQVYPNLSRNGVAAALLSRTHFGLKSHRQIGKGRDFEKLRDYSAGDAFDEVHWKATARRGRPIVKVFQVERAQQLYVLIDTSRHSGRHQTLDYFVESALVLGLAAEKAGDQFGVLTFSDRVHKFVRAHSGTAHFTQCRGAIYDAYPQPVSADFPELAAFLQTRLRKRALLFVLTNLDDPYASESLTSQLRLLAKRHLVVTASLAQPFANLIFDGPKPKSVEDLYSAVAGHQFWHKTRELSQVVHCYGAQLAVCTPENIYERLADHYLRLKQRQML